MGSEDVVQLDDANWEKEIEKGENPIIVMFYSDTCAYCKQMEPYFFDYAGEFREKIMFARVNILNSPTIASRYGVMGTPTFKFFCKGKPVHEMTGAVYPSLLKKAIEDNLEHGKKCVENATWIPSDITGYT
jgi:thioredoxin-like negative regulator of GroEL